MREIRLSAVAEEDLIDIWQINSGEILIVRVLHGRMDPEAHLEY